MLEAMSSRPMVCARASAPRSTKVFPSSRKSLKAGSSRRAAGYRIRFGLRRLNALNIGVENQIEALEGTVGTELARAKGKFEAAKGFYYHLHGSYMG